MFWARWFFGLMLCGAIGAVTYAQTNPNFVSGQVLNAAQLNSAFQAKADFPIPVIPLSTGVSGILPLQNGGTGATVFTTGNPLIGNGTSPLQQGARSGNTTVFATTSGSIAAGNCVKADASGNLIDNGASCGGGGGGGTPGGPNTAVQRNLLGAFSGDANFTYNGSGMITLGASGTLGSITFGNASSGTLILQPVTGALGAVTVSVPDITDTLMTKTSTDLMLNKTFDTGGAGNNFSIAGVAVTANSGTGAVARQVSPVFTTPTLGAASATTINGNTFSASTYTLTGTPNKTLTFNNSITLAGTDATTWTGPATNMTVAALNIADQTITGGANVTSLSQSTGNITIDCGARPTQFITNNGAWTITAPATDGSCLLLITNGASAQTPGFTGFTVGSNTGDALSNTIGSKFTLSIWRINGTSGYRVAAHQ